MPEWPFSSGEMADRIRAHDWSRTSLGPIGAWTAELRTAVDIMLAMPGTATLLWGPDAVQLYNDAYVAVARDRHPALLGRPVAQGWPDLYEPVIAPLIAAARDGRASVRTDIAVPLDDPARPDADRLYDTHWSPVYGPGGTVAGILQTMTDVTRRRTEKAQRADEWRYRTALESRLEAGAAELKRSDALLAATMDSSLDMIQVFEAVRDASGRIVDFRWILANHASEARYGAVTGDRLLERNPGVVAEGIFDAFCRVVETGVADQRERYHAHEHFDGWFFHSVVKLGDGVATTTKEISDWKAAQAEVLHLQDQMAQSRLRESERRLALAFRTLPVGVAILDADGRTIMANDEMRRFLPTGILPSQDPDAVGRWFAYDGDGAAIPSREFPGARALRGDSVAGIDMIYHRPDGRSIWTQVSAAPLLDEQGGVDGAFGVIVDIDRLKRSEAAARESEERLRQFGEASRDVLWSRDARTLQWRYLTPAFETIYGLSRDDVLTGNNLRSWLDLVVPEDRGLAIDAMRRVRGGEHVTFDYRIRRASDGAIRWLRDTDFPILDAHGAVSLIGGIGEDITEERSAREALQRSEERLRSAVEVGRLGLWDWNVSTGEVHWSDEHFRMEGYAVGEVKPSYDAWRARLHPDDRAGAEAALTMAMNGRHEYVREFRVVHADGTVRWLSGRGRFFYAADGRPTRMIGAMVDTTDRREWEERQTVLIAELQHRTRNLIGVIRAIADKTARGSVDLPDFKARFGDRLDALSRVQGLLSRLAAHDRVTFDDLIRAELSAMDGNAARVTTAGPAGVRLRSSSVQTLAMAIHELATNAIKYGALAQPEGRLEIRWRVDTPDGDDRRWLLIDWRERGVTMPAAGAAPRGTGQGRELIEQALPYQLGARTTYVLGADGVHCTIGIRISDGTAASRG